MPGAPIPARLLQTLPSRLTQVPPPCSGKVLLPAQDSLLQALAGTWSGNCCFVGEQPISCSTISQ